jgi:polyferredoxin
MDKIGKPRGLISYATLSDYQANMALATDGGTHAVDPRRVYEAEGRLSEEVRHFRLRHLIRPRTLIYAGLWTLVGLGLLVALVSRDRLEINVLHDRNPLFVTLSDGAIRNGYAVKLLNMIPEERVIVLSLVGLPGATMSAVGSDQPEGRTLVVPVEPDRLRSVKIYIRQPADLVAGNQTGFEFLAEDRASGEADTYSAVFYGPEGR